MRALRRRLAWLAAAALAFFAAAWLGDDGASAQPDTFAARVLAPIAGPIAAYHRIASEAAVIDGRPDRSLEHLQRGLAVARSTTVLWEDLVERQGLWFASAVREADGERRVRWLREALRTAETGIAHAERPGRVAFAAATALLVQARSDPPAPWPDGLPELYLEAARWYRRAAALGDPRGVEAARWCEGLAAAAAASAGD